MFTHGSFLCTAYAGPDRWPYLSNRGFQFFPVDGSRQLYRVMSVATVQGLPSKWTGSLRPKSFSTVGATSTIAGFSSAILKLEKSTPGTSRGSDRKSTRLNSSHSSISYAVFCLKKKTE